MEEVAIDFNPIDAVDLRDISDEVTELSQQVQELQEEIERNQRLATIGTTVIGLAHSIRSALGLCRAATHMVDRALRTQNLANIEHAWGMVKRNSSRTAELVNALLDMENCGRLHLQRGNPDTIADEVAEVATEQALDQDDILQLELSGDLDGVIFDRQAVHRCCVELITNSLDALAESPASGRVILRTARVEEGWTLTVADTGPGMTPEQLQSALRGGFTTKGKGGSGLGLQQVRQLVAQHCGTVDVLSEPGKGTSVRCFFPLNPHGSSQRVGESTNTSGVK